MLVVILLRLDVIGVAAFQPEFLHHVRRALAYPHEVVAKRWSPDAWPCRAVEEQSVFAPDVAQRVRFAFGYTGDESCRNDNLIYVENVSQFLWGELRPHAVAGVLHAVQDARVVTQ